MSVQSQREAVRVPGVDGGYVDYSNSRSTWYSCAAALATHSTRAALSGKMAFTLRPLKRSLTAGGIYGRGRRLHGTVSGHLDGTTGYITLDHPGRQNAISVEMYRGVPTAVRQASGGRVLVMRGSDNAFSSGSDISEFKTVRTGAAAATAYSLVEAAASTALLAVPQPLLACIHGPCIGGGLNLALAADIRFAAEDATFSVPPARLGIGFPRDLMELLVRAVGSGHAKELLFTARVLSGCRVELCTLASTTLLTNAIHHPAPPLLPLSPLPTRFHLRCHLRFHLLSARRVSQRRCARGAAAGSGQLRPTQGRARRARARCAATCTCTCTCVWVGGGGGGCVGCVRAGVRASRMHAVRACA